MPPKKWRMWFLFILVSKLLQSFLRNHFLLVLCKPSNFWFIIFSHLHEKFLCYRPKYIDILITLEKYSSVLCCLLRQEDAVKIVHIVLNHLDTTQEWKHRNLWTRMPFWKQLERCSFSVSLSPALWNISSLSISRDSPTPGLKLETWVLSEICAV